MYDMSKYTLSSSFRKFIKGAAGVPLPNSKSAYGTPINVLKGRMRNFKLGRTRCALAGKRMSTP